MNNWSIKEVAEMLGITTQAIYKNKEFYIKQGYIEKDINGAYKITVAGYNYLSSHTRKKSEKEEANQEPSQDIQKEYIEILKKQIEKLENELKETKANHIKELEQEQVRTAYFKELFEQKDRQISLYLLPGAKEEKAETKKGFFYNLFNK